MPLTFLHVVMWLPPLQTPQPPSGKEKGPAIFNWKAEILLGTTRQTFGDVYSARTGSYSHSNLCFGSRKEEDDWE